jgi:hypothetical protein
MWVPSPLLLYRDTFFMKQEELKSGERRSMMTSLTLL